MRKKVGPFPFCWTVNGPRHVEPVTELTQHERQSDIRIDKHVNGSQDEQQQVGTQVRLSRDEWSDVRPALPHNNLNTPTCHAAQNRASEWRRLCKRHRALDSRLMKGTYMQGYNSENSCFPQRRWSRLSTPDNKPEQMYRHNMPVKPTPKHH